MLLPQWSVILVSVLSLCLSFEVDNSVTNSLKYTSANEWVQQLNEQYLLLNQYSASFAWELTVNPSKELYETASEFGGIRIKWRNIRCEEAKYLENGMTSVQLRMIQLLCRGPKYTDYQANELSALLTKIQNIYTDTRICLPSGYDVCLNYNRIWNYTYVKTPQNEILPLDMSYVAPKDQTDYNPLHFFDGKLSDDYYILRGAQNGIIRDPSLTDKNIRGSHQICLSIDPELEDIMAGDFEPLQRADCALPADTIFRWAWEGWRLAVGPEIGKYYPGAVQIMNLGAQNNGYNDIGESWREELEMKNLRNVVNSLWQETKPYYEILHAVFRSALWNKYRDEKKVSRKGTIPAHLTGNMWSHDWSSYQPLLTPSSEFSLETSLKKTNWSTIDMVLRAEDFYTSLGLRPMTEKFWKLSSFSRKTNKTKCHGSAANMYNVDDFRMIVCANTNLDDFYVIVHEMGHIEYYMEYVDQPPLFQDAANSALGESLGDAIFLAMMTPHHLNRLGLLPDKYLYTENLTRFRTNQMRLVHEWKVNSEFLKAPSDQEIIKKAKEQHLNEPIMQEYLRSIEGKQKLLQNLEPITFLGMEYPKIEELNERMRNYNHMKEKTDYSMNSFDLTLLLRTAMSRLPQIPFAYILETFRWDLFSNKVKFSKANEYFWQLNLLHQGIHPPDWKDRSEFFDAAAKFHIPDNTPYVRYFLASFLHVQIFKGLCEATVFGYVNVPKKLPMPLHRCDIYGSKRAGKLIQKATKLGSSVHWTEVLYILTGKKEVTIEPLLEYYQPLFDWLEKLIIEFDLPVGWD